MKLYVWAAVLCLAVGCAPRGPVLDTGPFPEGVGGTIAGSVTASEATPIAGRRVTATNEATKARFETTTAVNGGYSMQVPSGTYRLDVELRPGETLSTRPDVTDVGVGDIDSARDFVVTVTVP